MRIENPSSAALVVRDHERAKNCIPGRRAYIAARVSTDNAASSPRGRTLVTDFDGTITLLDFYDLVRQQWPVPPDDDPWEQYVAGKLTHFEALAAIFARIRTDEATLLQLVGRMQFDPQFAPAVQRLRAAGWEVVVASAGCNWYIQHLLSAAGTTLEVHANHGKFSAERGLQMSLPVGSRFFSRQNGIDKLAVVSEAIQRSSRVAFAGDGRPDLASALAVEPELRFARGWLATELKRRGEPFHSFHRWSEIADVLLKL